MKRKKKGPSSKDAEKQANAANQQVLVNNQKRQDAQNANGNLATSGTTPSSSKIIGNGQFN